MFDMMETIPISKKEYRTRKQAKAWREALANMKKQEGSAEKQKLC